MSISLNVDGKVLFVDVDRYKFPEQRGLSQVQKSRYSLDIHISSLRIQFSPRIMTLGYKTTNQIGEARWVYLFVQGVRWITPRGLARLF